MPNIYEKAREFREKYYVPAQPEKNDIFEKSQIKNLLEMQIEKFARSNALCRSQILVLEEEIEMIKADIDDFLIIYYERFSEIMLRNNIFSAAQSIIGSDFGDEAEDNISLFERKEKAFSKELKLVYRRLAKLCHPDSSDNKFYAKYFSRIQELYKYSALDELLYMEARLSENEPADEENIVKKLERFESASKNFKEKLSRLEDERQQLLSSAEYRLLIKYKLSQIRGYDFFERIIRNSKIVTQTKGCV